MKRKNILITLANYIPVLFAFLVYAGGAPLVWPVFILCQILLVFFNYKFTDKIYLLTFLSTNLLVSTIIANKLSTYLYYKNISSDNETLAVGELGLIFGMIFVLFISLISILIKLLIKVWQKKKKSK